MRKRQIVFIVLACLAAVAGVLALFTRDNGPRYQGRSLSEWLMIHCESDRPNRDPAQRPVAASAIRAIGTNALPQLLEWICYETPSWHSNVTRALPRRLALRLGNSRAARATLYRGYHRAAAAEMGFRLIETNAVSAIPHLQTLLRDRSKPRTALRAMIVLTQLGAPGFDVLRAAALDTTQPYRDTILAAMASAPLRDTVTNDCLDTLGMLTADPDPAIRTSASNLIRYLKGGTNSAPRFL
jgi:hypothetical protein